MNQQPNPLKELIEKLTHLSHDERVKLHKEIRKHPMGRAIWKPNPGAQTDAYWSKADEIGFGGEAGPGKTALLVGLSLTQHDRSLILRRTNKEARKLVRDYIDVLDHRNGLNTGEGVWHLADKRCKAKVIDYGGCEHEDDKQKYKGDPHDLIGFDEVVDFTRSQFEFIKQWNRSKNKKQRCRVVATFNPPTRPVGMWVIQYWGPWLDPKHPNPAKYGELRWFTQIDGEDTEVDGPGPHMIDGEPIMARSRTFIRGHLHENPYLEGYDAVRAVAPKHLRAAYKKGDFEASLADVPGQLIPSAWVRAAQDRWKESPPEGVPMCAMGVDTTGGGDDPMVIACRYDGWYPPLIETPGEEMDVNRLGAQAAGIVISHRRDSADIIIDMGGGYGGSLNEILTGNGISAYAYKGAETSTARTEDRKLGFFNKRSEVYWKFREALNPEQPGGSPIALPNDQKLFADLTTPTFEVAPNGIKLESKESVIERLGRSPDHGDAVVMAWIRGATHLTHHAAWRNNRQSIGRQRVVSAYAHRKRHR